MRRATLVALALLVPLALTAPAWASDHLMTISEIQLSAGGDGSKQFVELRDPAGESFPSEPYSVAVYGADGTPVGSTPITTNALDGSTDPYTLASAEQGGNPDQPLTTVLPQGAGQVCFENSSGQRITCLAYGCVANPLTGGTSNVVAPPDGQSLQRQAGGGYAVAAPTQDAPNATGTSAACPGGPNPDPDPGPGPGGGADATAPVQTVAFKKRQDIDKLAVSLRLDEDAAVTVRGSVKVPNTARRLKFKVARADVTAGVRKKLRLKLGKRALKAVRRALASGRKLRAKVRITATDKAGNDSTRKVTIALKD